ncbi:hypothetical protein [Streptomyces marincola]|uniref:hypothetical protein n=1 Tax=Streptomyces marincola TaxID=2878388 RepID=UPI001CF2B863|nr:hypothetical protein [Streptomyces marincola]UCM89816.1 hypothetical protein LC193_18700 [Streptomyces marincola]
MGTRWWHVMIGGAVLVALAGCGGEGAEPSEEGQERTATSRATAEDEAADEAADADEAVGAPEASDEEAVEWLDRARQAAGDVTEVRMHADMTSEDVQMITELVVSGDRCTTSLEYPGLGVTDAVHVGEEIWVRPAELYWWGAEGGEDSFDTYAGAYVRGPQQHPHLRTLGCRSAFEMLDEDEPGAEYTHRMGPETVVDGQRAVTVLVRQTQPEGTSEQTILIAAEGDPHVLRMRVSMEFDMLGGRSMYTAYEWTDYGRPAAIEPPADDVTVHIDDLAERDNPFPLQ